MHELSLAESILEIVEEYEVRYRFSHVNSIHLSYGRLSCIEPKALQFAFEVQSKGSKSQDAELIFDVLPAVIHCFTCNVDMEIQGAYDAQCPKCHGEEVILTGGTEELKILDLNVD
jgi:hydrogenase nickel incorporation protein HypA/HybF